jgi:hypothetical protein
MSASSAASFSFSQPRSAAALSMAYSPLTWYTLIGRLVLSRRLQNNYIKWCMGQQQKTGQMGCVELWSTLHADGQAGVVTQAV